MTEFKPTQDVLLLLEAHLPYVEIRQSDDGDSVFGEICWLPRKGSPQDRRQTYESALEMLVRQIVFVFQKTGGTRLIELRADIGPLRNVGYSPRFEGCFLYVVVRMVA